MWIILSIITAFFYAVEGAWIKKLTARVNSYTITWSLFTFAIPVAVIPLFITGIPEIKGAFLWSAAGSLLINTVAFTLFVNALKIAPLSMTYPFLAFTPVFIIVTGYVFLGELPGLYGITGIFFVTLGAYVLNIKKIRSNLLAPFKAIKNEKGAVFMLVVAVLWSFAASLDKVAVLSSGSYFYVTFFNIGFFLLYMPFLFKVNPQFMKEVRVNLGPLFLLGVVGGLMSICQMSAVNIAYVSYVIAIKRAGMIFALIIGWMFFNEKMTLYKTVGTLLILSGIAIIALLS
ncbi:EamA family transporter [Elusimicrobiota bacterium]